jgi:hypothetical protein
MHLEFFAISKAKARTGLRFGLELVCVSGWNWFAFRARTGLRFSLELVSTIGYSGFSVKAEKHFR